MSKFKEITKMLGLNVKFVDNDILYRLLEINSVESVHKKINRKYPDNSLYEQNILDIEAIIEKYNKKIME